MRCLHRRGLPLSLTIERALQGRGTGRVSLNRVSGKDEQPFAVMTAFLNTFPRQELEDAVSALESRKQEGIAKHSVAATATIHDTLAMREIAIGASKNDFSRDRCARIQPHLAAAYRIYRDDKNKDDMRIVSQHYNLYETVCVQ